MFSDDEIRREVYEYLSKADNARSKKEALKFINKALEVNPDSLEAKMMLASFEDNPIKVLSIMDEALRKEKDRLKQMGCFNDASGLFNYLEIIPFVQGLYHEALVCANMGMISKAIELARETLRYDTGYTHARKLIIALYAHREDKDNLMKYYKKQDEEILDTLIPMLVFYYKHRNYKKAYEYLDKILKHNKYFMEIFGDLDEIIDDDEVVIGEKSEVCAAKANLEFLLVTVPALEAFCLNKQA